MALNKFIGIGRIGKDPEIHKFEGGGMVAQTSFAISENYVNKQGEKVENTEWLNLVFNGKKAEFAEQFIHKGIKLMIEGKLRTRSWEANGEKKYITEILVFSIIFCESKGGGQKQTPTPPDPSTFGNQQGNEPTQQEEPSDTLPF